MTASGNKEQYYFSLAFELAYYIHINKDIAFFVAEDALSGLASMLDHYERDRKPSARLRGFLKSGERTRPIRQTVRLSEPQMLQWLVYKHSEAWERQTEKGEGLYLTAEEDLIVRYVQHLVFTSLRRGSFYVTLAIGSLLHHFDRRETRVFYDILTQSDSARMKDTNYIGKQRLEMFERVSQRFGAMIQIVNKPGNEKQFVMRAMSPAITNLVIESLRRFTPWESACVLESGFDVTDIAGLYFTEPSGQDEELIEMNRIHTVLDPACFKTFGEGLARYVRTLPNEDQDKVCKYEALDERLEVPQFSNFPEGPSRGDRFQPPKLTAGDFIRLERMLSARAQRRKAFVPRQLHIYIDDVLSYSFDLKVQTRGALLIDRGASVVEVRGDDTVGELTLATLLLRDEQLHDDMFEDSVVQPSGQKVGVKLTPGRDADGKEGLQLEVTYKNPGLRWLLLQRVRRVRFGLTGISEDYYKVPLRSRPDYPRWARAGAAAAIVLVAFALTWWLLFLRTRQPGREPLDQSEPPSGQRQDGQISIASASPSPTPKTSPAIKTPNPAIAQASWSVDRETALRALSIERTRSETRRIDLSGHQVSILLSVPLYDDRGRRYTRYRVMLLYASGTRTWQQMLRSPRVSLTGYAHIMNLKLFPQQLSESNTYDLSIEGSVRNDWSPLGKVTLDSKRH